MAGKRVRLLLAVLTSALLAVGAVVVPSLSPAGAAESVTVSLGDASGLERDTVTGSVFVPVFLSDAAAEPVTVSFFTVAGSATEGADYTRWGSPSSPRTVTIPAGALQSTINVPVLADAAVEPDEAFSVEIASVSGGGAVIGDDTGVATIVDADGVSGVNPAITVSSGTVVEGDGGQRRAQFLVHLSRAPETNVTISYTSADGTAVAPGDYTAKLPGTVVFAPGQISKTVDVLVDSNTVVDGDRTLNLEVTVTGGSPVEELSTTGTATITDDDTAVVAPATPLTGEFLSNLLPATLTSGTCNTGGDSTFTFTSSGAATGPYPGTYTETGTVTIGAQVGEPVPGQFPGEITAFTSTFTITSGAVTITGTKSLVPGTTFNYGSCITGSNPAAQIIASSLTYTATIQHPSGTYSDSGSTWDNFNMYVTPTANSSSLQFRSGFTSTSFGPGPVDAELAGRVFEDLNGDGLSNSGLDVGLAGRTVKVFSDTDGDGSFDAGEPLVASPVTDSTGVFTILLPEGDYVVCQVTPTNWVSTGPSAGVCAGDPGVGENGAAVSLTASTPQIQLGSFETSIWRAAVFNDLDGNATPDVGEPYLAGWTLSVYRDLDGDLAVDPGEPLFGSAVTVAQLTGVEFRLPPGTYLMCQTPQAGWTQNRPSVDRCSAVSAYPGGFATTAQSGGYGNDYRFGVVPA